MSTPLKQARISLPLTVVSAERHWQGGGGEHINKKVSDKSK